MVLQYLLLVSGLFCRYLYSRFPDELEKADRKALDNMNVHQELIDKILTADLYRHFENRKENSRTGKYEMRLAFFYNNKRYFFKELLPHKGSTGNSCYMIRIANPKRTTREVDFVRMLQPDEPSALVIIDNRKDQQRILIEHTRAWKDTDDVRNILQSCLQQPIATRFPFQHLSLMSFPIMGR